MAVLEIGRSIRGELIEVFIVNKQLVTRRHKDTITVKGDSPQTSIPTPTLPVDVGRIPVYCLPYATSVQINQKYTTVTFALMATANDRSGNEDGH